MSNECRNIRILDADKIVSIDIRTRHRSIFTKIIEIK